MIVVDVNLLIYSYSRQFAQHDTARNWLETQFNTTRVALPWSSLLGFIRVLTNARIFGKPESTSAAWSRVKEWLQRDNVWIPEPGEKHLEILESLLLLPGISNKLIPDAHIAALAIEHGLTLYSTDNDFARFPGLRWVNPLAPKK